MMLIREVPFPVDMGSCRRLSCLVAREDCFLGADFSAGKLFVWSETGVLTELEPPQPLEKLTFSPSNERYFALSPYAPGSIFILDPRFREVDRVGIHTEGFGPRAEDLWFEEDSGLLWLVFSDAVCRFSTAGDCLGVFMTAPRGTQYQALCTLGERLYLAYRKGGCGYLSAYSRQGAHRERVSLGGEYTVGNLQPAGTNSGSVLQIFAVKDLCNPCALEVRLDAPPPCRSLSVECVSDTARLRATCHVDSSPGL